MLFSIVHHVHRRSRRLRRPADGVAPVRLASDVANGRLVATQRPPRCTDGEGVFFVVTKNMQTTDFSDFIGLATEKPKYSNLGVWVEPFSDIFDQNERRSEASASPDMLRSPYWRVLGPLPWDLKHNFQPRFFWASFFPKKNHTCRNFVWLHWF